MSQVRFFSPSPLWDDLVGTPARFRAPALLRFGGDDFIEQYQAALEKEPRQLRGFIARPETWREPAVGLDGPTVPGPLRLYQPVHGRFYLVATSLACRVPGLPEHTVDVAKGEVVAFVLRRLTTVKDWKGAETETGEWAWVKRADGSEGWVRAGALALADGEEQIPMFASTFAGSGGLRDVPMRRRVFAGLIPASKRETFANGSELSAQPQAKPAAGSLDDPRVIEFQRAVMDPWAEMKEWYDDERYDTTDDRRVNALLSVEQSSPLLLMDMLGFFETHLKPLAAALKGSAATLSAPQQAIYNLLNTTHAVDRSGLNEATLVEMIRQVLPHRDKIESPAGPPPAYAVRRVLIGDPGRFTRPPAGQGSENAVPNPVRAVIRSETGLRTLLGRGTTAPWELTPAERPGGLGVRRLKKLVMDALAEAGNVPAVLAEQLPARRPVASAAQPGDDWFVVRCVYLRPHCGRRSPPVVSERSERFQLTSFFEPDAPARHLRVALPVDTSPATLRKYNRNVAFVISDQLRKQMSRAASLKDLMDGKAGPEKPGLDFAMICSFSIPIITICAFILLMIIVILLNIIFWWIPLFRICFPIPKRA